MSSPSPIPSSASDTPPLRLHPQLDQLGVLCEYIEEFGSQQSFSPADLHAFTLGAEELFANTLRHCQPPATVVEFSLSVAEDLALATYVDDGTEFDPTSLAEANTSLSASERAIGGLGIHFIRKTMPTFRYERREGRNITTFGRPLTRKPHAD